MRRGKPPVDLWITQAGYPQLHRRSISSSEVKGMFLWQKMSLEKCDDGPP
jgi:hypothetical protein